MERDKDNPNQYNYVAWSIPLTTTIPTTFQAYLIDNQVWWGGWRCNGKVEKRKSWKIKIKKQYLARVFISKKRKTDQVIISWWLQFGVIFLSGKIVFKIIPEKENEEIIIICSSANFRWLFSLPLYFSGPSRREELTANWIECNNDSSNWRFQLLQNVYLPLLNFPFLPLLISFEALMIYSLFQQSTPIHTHTHSILCQNSRFFKEKMIQKEEEKLKIANTLKMVFHCLSAFSSTCFVTFYRFYAGRSFNGLVIICFFVFFLV